MAELSDVKEVPAAALSELQEAAITWYITSKLGVIDPESQSQNHAAWDIRDAILTRAGRLDEISALHKAHLQQSHGVDKGGAGREL